MVDINEELLEETTKKVAQVSGQKVIPIVCDVSQSDQVQAMVSQAYKELDNVYILFNNAGIGIAYGRNICRIKEPDWDKIMAVNLKGQWLIAKSLWRKMKAQKFENRAYALREPEMIYNDDLIITNPTESDQSIVFLNY